MASGNYVENGSGRNNRRKRILESLRKIFVTEGQDVRGGNSEETPGFGGKKALTKEQRRKLRKKKLETRTFNVNQRLALADNYKGFVVLLFVFSHMAWQFNLDFPFPDWFFHYNPNSTSALFGFFNFSFMDIGPVTFFFITGLTMVKAFSNNARRAGELAAFKHFFIRNVAVIGFFFIARFVQFKMSGRNSLPWAFLISIGMTGVLLVPFMFSFIRRHWWLRLLIGIGILFAYHRHYDFLFEKLGAADGGIAACVGFAGVVMLVSVLEDLAEKGFLYYLGFSILLAAAAVLLKYKVEAPSYGKLNVSFMIMATLAMNIPYLFFYLLDFVIKKRQIPIIASLGRNILFFLLLDGIILYVVKVDRVLSMGQFLSVIGIVFAVYAAFGFLFDKTKTTIKL